MLKKYLNRIKRTPHYNFDRSKYLRLDKNERIIPFNKKILIKLKKIISSSIIQSYPVEMHKLQNLISVKEKINKKYINITPGVEGAIKYIFEIFSDGNRIAASIYPTYGMVNVYSKVYKYKIIRVNLVNKIFDIKKFFIKKTSFIYIANPNQPSGQFITEDNILKIIKRAKKNDTYVIIDETYIDFCEFESISKMVKKFKNLIVLKSLSKSFGIAGLRVGYLIASPHIIKILNTVRPSYDVSSFSIKVAEYFLKHIQIKNSFLKNIKEAKKYLINECLRRNIKFQNTQANFFYIILPNTKIKTVSNFMFKNKILVSSKHQNSFKSSRNSIRITVGKKEQMRKFFALFDKIYKRI